MISLDPVIIASISTSFTKDNSNKYSSLAGGTTLYIKGTGFGRMESDNVVMLGNNQCKVVGNWFF